VFRIHDGQYLYYSKYGQPPGIWRMPVTGGEEPVRELQTLTHRDWDAANGGIYFVDAQSAPVLKFFRFDTGRVTRRLRRSRGPLRRELGCIADGRSS